MSITGGQHTGSGFQPEPGERKKGTYGLGGTAVDAGTAGSIEVVRVADLRIDHLYQRELSMDVVERIAANYDMVTAGTIVVSRRADGTLFLIDGQHRAAAAIRAGETEMLAQVLTGLGPKKEARLRLQANYRRTDRIWETFKARLFANDPVAIGMQRVAQEYGTQINVMPAQDGINALSSAEKVYRLDNGVAFARVLGSLRVAFGELNPENTTAYSIKGLHWFLERHGGEIDHERLHERMRTEGPAALYRMARNQASAMGGTLWLNYYRALVEAYNFRLSEQHRLEWSTGRWSKSGLGKGADNGWG